MRDEIQASYGNYVEYIANATIYDTGQFNWDGIVPKDTCLDDLDNLEIRTEAQTDKDDGSYIIYVVPGSYDLILERLRISSKCSNRNNYTSR
ncbi:MAG: hypothetical protein HFJ54_08110 [Clostridia bacterium]|nr:hypothetical protein [Clostridia bacterium]